MARSLTQPGGFFKNMGNSLSNMDPMMLSIASQLINNSAPSTQRRSLLQGMGPAILQGQQMQQAAAERKRQEEDRKRREAAMAKLPFAASTMNLLENEASQGATTRAGKTFAPYTPDVPGATRRAQEGIFAAAYPEAYGAEMGKRIFGGPTTPAKSGTITVQEGTEKVTYVQNPDGTQGAEISRGPMWQERAPTAASSSKTMYDSQTGLPAEVTNQQRLETKNPDGTDRYGSYRLIPADAQGNVYADTHTGRVLVMDHGVPVSQAWANAMPRPDAAPAPAAVGGATSLLAPQVAEGAPVTAPERQTGVVAEDAAADAVGLLNRVQRGLSKVFGGLMEGVIFEDERQAEQFVLRLNQDLKTLFVNNEKFPVAEQNTVQGFLVDPSKWFEDPDFGAQNMTDLRKWMNDKHQANLNAIDRGGLNPAQRAQREGQNADISRGLELMGPEPQTDLGDFEGMTLEQLQAIDINTLGTNFPQWDAAMAAEQARLEAIAAGGTP